MNALRLVVVAAVSALTLVLACAKPLPTEQPLAVRPLVFAPGEAREPDNVVIVTDASGTMYARQTFPLAKALTQSFVRGMPDADQPALRSDYHTALIGFGGDERQVTGPASFDRDLLASGADELRILGSIDGMGGDTPICKVLREIGEMTPRRAEGAGPGPHYLAVVIFSDGLPDCDESALEAGQLLVDTFDGAVCFHTVQTGDDPAGTEFLRSLTALTDCGSYRTADSVRTPEPFMQLVRDVFVGGAPMDDCGRIVLQGVTFAFDKWNITPESAVVLDVAAERLHSCAHVPIRIEGHTDWIGTDAYNQGLSERRARSVYDYLKRAGVTNELSTVGFGEKRPIAPNAKPDGSDDPVGRAKNRRVELHGAR